MRPLVALGVFVMLLGVKTPALAEVADKEPSIADMWLLSFVAVSLVLLAAWIQRYVGYALWIVVGLGAFGPIMEWHDPYVGPAIARELGAHWGLHAYATFAFSLIVPVIGFVFLALSARRRTRLDDW